MYVEHVGEIVRCNRQYFLPPGVEKRWWHFFKSEYPKCLLNDRSDFGICK